LCVLVWHRILCKVQKEQFTLSTLATCWPKRSLGVQLAVMYATDRSTAEETD
jgi:hypothetical protein